MTLSQHAAPGANAGYTFQFERALFWLASSPAGFVIGIETDDDVSVQGADGSRVLEQDKHSIRDDSNPFADRSKGLWNTLATWLQALDDGEVRADNTRFLMVTNRTVSDCIARRIHSASSEEDCSVCITELEAAANKPPETVAPHMTRVLRPESQANLIRLISNCELADASSASSGIDLRINTIAELRLPEWHIQDSDSILDELRGWLVRAAMDAWQQGDSFWVKRDHFTNAFHTILDGRQRRIRRERAEHLIPISEDELIGAKKGRPFVKQVQFVTEDDNIVDNAIREFIRCNIEKMRLSSEVGPELGQQKLLNKMADCVGRRPAGSRTTA
jgi:hypothetical protein